MVTGASAGFGAEIAARFAANGDRVIAAARRGDRLADLSDRFGASLLAIELDVRDRAAVAAAIADLPAEFADIDILVNNAGLARGIAPAQETDLDDWEAMVDTNVKGVMYLTHAVLPGMVARGRGHIIGIGSIAGAYAYPGGNVYGGTKAFVQQFNANLRTDLFGTPIRVTTIEPGLVGGTEFSTVRFDGDQARARSMYDGTEPLMPGDIAEAVTWVAGLPAHVNINRIEMMPVVQSPGPLRVHRPS
nr:SDR family NAD(P)-dependent oxidoreductase [Nakamurella flavida]